MNKSLLFTALAGILLSLAAGCTADTHQIHTPAYGEKPAGYKFEKIKNARLELAFGGPQHLKSGVPAEIFFILKNQGEKPIVIEEWRMNEPDNLRVECQIWLPGQKEPDPDRWLSMDLPVKQPELRYFLKLNPGNQTRIAKKLDFVESLVVTPGAERRYFIRASLNLSSVKCSSPVAAIAVTSGN